MQAEDLPRSVVLEGVTNCRDLGGWPAADGARVRFGQVYRSASLGRLTAADVAALGTLGITHVCDLRGDAERLRTPSRLDALPRAIVHALPIEPSLGPSLLETRADAAETLARMRRAYVAYALEWSHRYRALFALLLREEGPLLFHCTAGKDRTGFGAALLLAALGVAREAIQADYLATARLWRADESLAALLPPAVARALLGVHADLLDAAFDAIEAQGGMDAYLRDRIGLDDAAREKLRGKLLA